MSKRLTLSLIFLGLASTPAFAHLAPGEHGSLAAGLSHPLFGLDHVLAMVVVGLWACQIGGKALWMIPASFVGTMMVGFLLALGGLSVPFVEPVILASVVALGLLVAMAVRLPVGPGMLIVGVFALFHGYAHGGELGAAGALPFAAGFGIATVALHGVGVGFGLLLRKVVGDGTVGRYSLRLVGAVSALAGIALVAG